MGVDGWSTLVTWGWAPIDILRSPRIAIDTPNYLLRRMGAIKREPRPRVPTEHISLALGVIRAALRRSVVPVMVFDGPPESLKRNPNPELVSSAADVLARFSKNCDVNDEETVEILRSSPALRYYFSMMHIKELCSVCGVPAITAPSEAEMMAAVLCKEGVVGTVVSNDADALLFGSPHVSRTLHLSTGQLECTTLQQLERTTELTLDQMRDLAILSGCDFSKGVKGIGPRRGLVMLKRYGKLEAVLKARGISLADRESLLNARAVFDEPEYLFSNKGETELRPPLPAGMLRLLRPVLGDARAEKQVQTLVQMWKVFGQSQSSLEQWL